MEEEQKPQYNAVAPPKSLQDKPDMKVTHLLILFPANTV